MVLLLTSSPQKLLAFQDFLSLMNKKPLTNGSADMALAKVKGIHRVKKRLATGDVTEHHYAWRGGPRFWSSDSGIPKEGPQYWGAYHAIVTESRPSHGLFRDVLKQYLESPEFRKLAPRTQADMRKSIERSPFDKNGKPRRDMGIDAQFGDAPLNAFNRREIRTLAYRWRDAFTPRAADKIVSHLSAILSWAFDRNIIAHHHILGMTKVYSADRADITWTEEEIAAILTIAPEWVQRILIAASETGLRPGDLRLLSRAHIQKTPKGRRIVLRTGKRNRMVSIPVTQKMGELIDATPKDRFLLLVNSENRQFSKADHLGRAVSLYRDKAGVRRELHLYDARGTAATRLYAAGATLQEIGLAMGWAPAHAARMIETYVHLNPSISDDLLIKLARDRA